MAILDQGRFLTDPSELLPPPVTINLEIVTKTLSEAFYTGIMELITNGDLSYSDLDSIFDEFPNFYAINENRSSRPKGKKLIFITKMNSILKKNDECRGSEFNAFFDAKRRYQQERLGPKPNQTTVMNRIKQLLDILS